jgi:hypothetical protein
MSTLTAKIQLRRDTSANWTSNNPVLLAGEIAITTDVLYSGTDQPRMKIGNGTDTWLNLDYIPLGGSANLQAVTDLGATTTNAINTAGITSDYLQLDTTATNTNAVGKLVWNDTLGTGEIGLKGGNINAKLAQDLYARVVNKTTQNLLRANYQAVKVQSAQGQRLAVNFAQANNDNNSADTIGIVAENIDNNQEGFVITVGQIENINTTGSLQGETWADGDVIYLSPTTAGSLTNVKPNGSTGHIIVIGYIEYAHQNNGKIYVKIMNGWELDELHNVYINQGTLANNDALIYESSTQLWKNKTIETALGYTPSQFSMIQMYMGLPSSTFNPADATVYYFAIAATPATGVASFRAINVTKNITLKAISSLISVVSTVGSSENSTLDFQVYNQSSVLQTTTNITTTLKFDNASKINIDNFDNLNIDIPANSLIVLKLTTATFVTNPTNIYGVFNLTFN